MAGHHAHAAQLQDTLVRTFEARALAVKKVWTNPGSKTPGLDGVVWQNDADLMEAVGTLRDLSAYTPMPVKRVYIPKARGGRRPLGIPTLYDRAVQTLFTLALMPIAECEADRRSYGYRPYKSAHDAATYLKLVLGAKYAKRWVLEADIEMFFDSLSHEWLLQNIPMNPKVLKKFLKAGFMELPHPEVHETPGGTPQGGAISPVLANMALNGLEQALGDAFRVVRFADDFVVIGASKEALHDRALPVVRAFLQPRGLTLAAAKTAITPIERGFDFLGLTFREYKDDARAVGYKQGIFLVTPSKASVLAFKKRLKQAIKSLHKHSARAVIIKVNPMLRGWAQYYKPFTSKKVFSALGHYVWTLLWRWCRKKHPPCRSGSCAPNTSNAKGATTGSSTPGIPSTVPSPSSSWVGLRLYAIRSAPTSTPFGPGTSSTTGDDASGGRPRGRASTQTKPICSKSSGEHARFVTGTCSTGSRSKCITFTLEMPVGKTPFATFSCCTRFATNKSHTPKALPSKPLG